MRGQLVRITYKFVRKVDGISTSMTPTWEANSTLAVSGYPVNAKDSVAQHATESSKAGDEDRTHDINLGKVALYR